MSLRDSDHQFRRHPEELGGRTIGIEALEAEHAFRIGAPALWVRPGTRQRLRQRLGPRPRPCPCPRPRGSSDLGPPDIRGEPSAPEPGPTWAATLSTGIAEGRRTGPAACHPPGTVAA